LACVRLNPTASLRKGSPMSPDAFTKPNLFDPLLGIQDVMAALGVSRSGVYSILAGGRLRAVKLGDVTKGRRSELERFIAALPEAKFGTAAQDAAGAHAA